MAPNIIAYIFYMVRDLIAHYRDPRIINIPFIGNLKYMVSVIVIYLLFVLYFGPKWMEKRRPFELKYVMQLYNAIQVVANTIIFLYAVLFTVLSPDFSMLCQPVDYQNTSPHMMHIIYASCGYYLLKYLDLLDTVFIVLRKKNSQVSFLHVYHHAGMVFGVCVYMNFLCASHCTMLGLINLLVHSVMYAYYFATSLGAVKQVLWWKRHITQVQLLQFSYLSLHFLLVIVRNPCQFPIFMAFVGFTQNIFMFAMFFDFYYKTYMRKPRQQVQQVDAADEAAQKLT
ncbi:elongation of very long chain fatty acids protein AAEL008004 [Drosophila grimshawi]|uniref:Elongation of very long chain fatty acids protein n=1 Tax=Drosophila grimshawi TaxID=7222 RepID=B4JSE3_DROGR|nr:elongation of very long chain fatty acids protein AAEL008004 [Drosophila grimshawi]EDV94683.1 GH22345 [Drosophila grimshawi]